MIHQHVFEKQKIKVAQGSITRFEETQEFVDRITETIQDKDVVNIQYSEDLNNCIVSWRN